MKKMYHLNTFLAITLFVALMAMVITRAFFPAVILPEANVPNLVLVSLVALLLDHYLAYGAKRCYICIPVLSSVTFSLLPFAACFVGALEAVKLGVLGGVVFTATTWLFSAMEDRLSTGPIAKLAPIMSALGLYLACQVFMGF